MMSRVVVRVEVRGVTVVELELGIETVGRVLRGSTRDGVGVREDLPDVVRLVTADALGCVALEATAGRVGERAARDSIRWADGTVRSLAAL
jgi:hypothetical protein